MDNIEIRVSRSVMVKACVWHLRTPTAEASTDEMKHALEGCNDRVRALLLYALASTLVLSQLVEEAAEQFEGSGINFTEGRTDD